MDISVIICTWNRDRVLRLTLEQFRGLQVPAGVTWELIVVDNNSTDGTRQVCEELTGPLPLRYLFEARPGKTYAQNFAVKEARGALLLFTDDDVDPDPDWLRAIRDAAQRHPEAGIFGGKVIPRFEQPPPDWVAVRSRRLCPLTNHYDEGDTERFQEPKESVVIGANMAMRKNVFEIARFREDMGPKGDEYTTHEETELIRRLIRSGQKCLYVPTAIIYHRSPAHRMTEKYLRKWYRGDGISQVRLGLIEEGRYACFGAPGHLWFKLIWQGLLYISSRWTGLSALWVPAEMRMARYWGVITEFRRRKRTTTDG